MSDEFDIAAREQTILGRPPRIAPLSEDEIPARVREHMNQLRASLGVEPLEGPLPELTATMLKAPALMDAHMALANCLFQGALSARDRELVILRTGWLCKAPFEWGEHVIVGKRLAHFTEDEILAIQQGSSAPGWSEQERAVLQAVEELISDAMITDETWAVLAAAHTEPQLLELPLLVGQYQGVAYLQNALRIRLMEGNEGLRAR